MNDKIRINDTEYAVPFAVSGMLKAQAEQIDEHRKTIERISHQNKQFSAANQDLTAENQRLKEEQLSAMEKIRERYMNLDAENQRQAEQIEDMVLLIRRLAARLPETSDIRHKAHDYLGRKGFQSQILRKAAPPQKGQDNK